MTRFLGLDLHKRTVVACMLAQDGQLLVEETIPAERQALLAWARRRLRARDQVALEATTNCWAVVDLLEPFVARVVASNPIRTKAIASAKVKTDKIDARVLAELLRCGFLPEVWQPDAQTRHCRRLSRRRAQLVRDRTRLKNRIQAVLAERLITPPVRNLFSAKGLEALAQLELDELGREAIDSGLRLLAAVEAELEKVDLAVAQQGYEMDSVRLLMTLPGVGLNVAQGVMAAWGDISRFPDADHAASYLGLAPSTRQSGAHCYHGPITKQGNSQARWLLIQAAQHLDRNPGPLGVFFRRLARKKNRNVAVVAAARKLATIGYHMLKNQEPYRYALPRSTETKLARLRVQATGKRRRGGTPPGQPRTPTYGSGLQRRRQSPLNEVYTKEQLPAASTTEQISKGEQRTLRRSGTLQHARRVQAEEFVPRRSGGEKEATST